MGCLGCQALIEDVIAEFSPASEMVAADFLFPAPSTQPAQHRAPYSLRTLLRLPSQLRCLPSLLATCRRPLDLFSAAESPSLFLTHFSNFTIYSASTSPLVISCSSRFLYLSHFDTTTTVPLRVILRVPLLSLHKLSHTHTKCVLRQTTLRQTVSTDTLMASMAMRMESTVTALAIQASRRELLPLLSTPEILTSLSATFSATSASSRLLRAH